MAHASRFKANSSWPIPQKSWIEAHGQEKKSGTSAPGPEGPRANFFLPMKQEPWASSLEVWAMSLESWAMNVFDVTHRNESQHCSTSTEEQSKDTKKRMQTTGEPAHLGAGGCTPRSNPLPQSIQTLTSRRPTRRLEPWTTKHQEPIT